MLLPRIVAQVTPRLVATMVKEGLAGGAGLSKVLCSGTEKVLNSGLRSKWDRSLNLVPKRTKFLRFPQFFSILLRFFSFSQLFSVCQRLSKALH